MYDKILNGIIDNISDYKGRSLCFTSNDKYLNTYFCKDLIKNLKDFNKYDLLEINPENFNIKIDYIRDIQEFISYKPNYSSYKIVVINEIEKMNIQASNAILKTLEEPPEHTIIITNTNLWNKLLPTIKSRLNKINIKLDSNFKNKIYEKYKNTHQYIKYFVENDFQITKFLYENSEDIILEQINIIKQKNIEELCEILTLNQENPLNKINSTFAYTQIIKNIIKNDVNDVLKISKIIIKKKENINTGIFLKFLSKISLVLIKDSIITKTSKNWSTIDLLYMSEFFGIEDYNFDIKYIEDSYEYYNGIINSKLSNFKFEIEIYTHLLRIHRCYSLFRRRK
ncbi:hypothetical protein OF820_02195 [Oceanotoga sp. DSM 15011]|jgi:DNA polymerase-3 subunit delta'/DNA polymerase-3 subunit gamma/tau|uniref:hypothetical protein n=1 Tax=Oceanotoga sp. DSM 15011 TaxID=2984951 RepID=UPI0021F49E7B|nr:hypothetical protein [Oceanotoga sp. DSM 15011]UYP00503.1 hypothetical protein OF820_02195 [Oceanotoga sp. DSM 15011]